jgi:hypothetical protein
MRSPIPNHLLLAAGDLADATGFGFLLIIFVLPIAILVVLLKVFGGRKDR